MGFKYVVFSTNGIMQAGFGSLIVAELYLNKPNSKEYYLERTY